MRDAFAGIDLGGTTIKAMLSDVEGTPLETRSIPTESHRGPAETIERMAGLVSDLLKVAGGRLKGVGLGVPGLADISRGTTLFLPNLPTQWRNEPVAKLLAERLDAPVRLLNDVRMATLGELRYGHGKQEPDLTMAFFAIGTGVGGGLALKGQLWLGPLGAAGELGHQTIFPAGPRCGCGNRGCLEAVASAAAISAEGVRLMRSGLAPALHSLVGGDANRVTTREMMSAADRDPKVMEALIDAAEAIGIAAANVVTILHPDMIVLGGGVAEIGPLLSDTVRKVIRERVGMFPTDDVRVEHSLLGDRAGLYGGIALARDAAQTDSTSSNTIF